MGGEPLLSLVVPVGGLGLVGVVSPEAWLVRLRDVPSR